MNPRALTWTAYLFMACQGYLLYAIGFMTPYLQSDLLAQAARSAGQAAGPTELPNAAPLP